VIAKKCQNVLLTTCDRESNGVESFSLRVAKASSVIMPSIFVLGAVDCVNNHLIYVRFSLPKPSNSKIVAREPISSIDGRRRSFFSFGWPASTTESVPPLSRTTSISRLRPISVLLCRSCASSMNRAIGLCRFLIRSRRARSRLSGWVGILKSFSIARS